MNNHPSQKMPEGLLRLKFINQDLDLLSRKQKLKKILLLKCPMMMPKAVGRAQKAAILKHHLRGFEELS